MPAPKKPTARPTEPTEDQKVSELIDVVDPVVADREQRVAGLIGTDYEGYDRTFIQRKMSFMPKIQFGKIVGSAFRTAMKDGLDMSDFIDGYRTEGANINFVLRVIAELSVATPDLVDDIYCIALGVPRNDAPVVKEIWQQAHDEETGTGGLSDHDGAAILKTFIDQNADSMRDFYQAELLPIFKQLQEKYAPTKPASKARK